MVAGVRLDPILSVPKLQWDFLCQELERRTQGEHESGAFLLGTEDTTGCRAALEVVFYDDLDPAAYETGVCVLHARSFGQLWEKCRSTGLQIVADIHVHPYGAGQSRSDRTNPMIAQRGHLALILPDFARAPISLSSVGFYQYLGSHQWRDLSGRNLASRLHIGD